MGNLLYELNPSTVNMRASLKILSLMRKKERERKWD